jgi:hypothetical protein
VAGVVVAKVEGVAAGKVPAADRVVEAEDRAAAMVGAPEEEGIGSIEWLAGAEAPAGAFRGG